MRKKAPGLVRIQNTGVLKKNIDARICNNFFYILRNAAEREKKSHHGLVVNRLKNISIFSIDLETAIPLLLHRSRALHGCDLSFSPYSN